ncbi:MAG TPA: ATP-binding protein [Caulobacteraceae bacterium]
MPAGALSIIVAAAAAAIGFLALGMSGQAPLVAGVVGALGIGALGSILLIRRLSGWHMDLAHSAGSIGAIDGEADPPFKAMLDGLPEPVLLVTGAAKGGLSAQKFLFANAAARRVLPIQRNEGPLATAIRSPEVLQAVEEALFGEGVGEAPFPLGLGQARQWRARAASLGAAVDGHPPLAILTLRDETDAIANARLRADFLANASHELRTPLASLSGFIETLSGHARDDPAARERFLPIMQAQADRMRRLIENLMSLSSIEQSEHLPPAGEVDLAQAAADVLDALDPQARIRGVRFERRLPAVGAAMIVGDRDQIVQVVQNLAENALKYSPKGGAVEIEVMGVQELMPASQSASGEMRHPLIVPASTAAGGYFGVGVRDGGPGIARTHLPRLTERFYRVEGQKSGEHAGTGLGLAIVKHIVNRHGGALFVDSALGAGSTFTACFRSLEPERRPVFEVSPEDQNG